MQKPKSSKYDTGYLNWTFEDMIYTICDGDFTKFEAARKMKITEAQKILLIKDKNNFMQWYQYEQIKDNT